MELFSIRIQRTFQLVSTISKHLPTFYSFYAYNATNNKRLTDGSTTIYQPNLLIIKVYF